MNKQETGFFVIELQPGKYVSRVIGRRTQGRRPIVITSGSLAEAKPWHLPSSVRKARARIGLGGRILICAQDGDGLRILGRLGKDTQWPET